METKKVVTWSIVGVVLLIVLAIAMTAARVGGEASKMDSELKAALDAHKSVDEMKILLTGDQYEMTVAPDGVKMTGNGPKHSLLVFGTWLTLELDFNADHKLTRYHLDRASSWF